MKHLQHISETSETTKTYSCNMCFQCNISLFTGGSGATALVDGGPAAVAACRGRVASAARAVGRPRTCDLERAAARRAWQCWQPSAAAQRRPRAVPGKACARTVRLGGGRALRLERPTAVRSEAAGERIRAI